MMNVSLRQLRAFVALARLGSFTQAATSLHITQSALSGLVKELEKTLDVRLIDRTTRRAQLSAVGRELYPLADKILQDLDGVLQDVASIKTLQKGVVRIAAPQLMCCTLLPQVIAAFRAEHPGIDVRLNDCMVEMVQARVFSGEVDFGIGPEREALAGVHSETLFEMPFMVVFPKRHPLAKLRQVRWQDATGHPFITLRGQFVEKLAFDLHRGLQGLTLTPNHEVSFMTTALSMVHAGLGITACLPYAASLVALYRLQMRELQEPLITRRFLVHAKTGRSLSPAAARFLDFLRSDLARAHWRESVAGRGAQGAARQSTRSGSADKIRRP